MDLLWAIFHLFRDPTQSGSTPSKHGEIHPRAQHGTGEIGRFTLFLGQEQVKLTRDPFRRTASTANFVR
jgi:hypothetical protein